MLSTFTLPRPDLIGANANQFVHESDTHRLWVYYGDCVDGEFHPLWHEKFNLIEGHPYQHICKGLTWNGDLMLSLLDEIENPDQMAYELTDIAREVLSVAQFAGVG